MNKVLNIIQESILKYIDEQQVSTNPAEYTGQHSAPTKEGNDPMYDINDMFPDIYTDNAYKYYGTYGLDDYNVINQIKRVRNRPNATVKIYRAVPYFNKDIDKKINELNKIRSFYIKYRFFPTNNDIVDKLEVKYSDANNYDETQKKILDDLTSQVEDLISKRQKPAKINNGDWVTTSLVYAKQHGTVEFNKDYRIITKTVKASQLYTDGNSIFEWGYNI